jgi:hypothetical protein
MVGIVVFKTWIQEVLVKMHWNQLSSTAILKDSIVELLAKSKAPKECLCPFVWCGRGKQRKSPQYGPQRSGRLANTRGYRSASQF